MIDFYTLGYNDRLKGETRNLQHFKSFDVFEYSRGWVQAWQDKVKAGEPVSKEVRT